MVEPVDGKLAALERSEARFRRIVHCADEGIWEIDAFGFITFVNPKMAALLLGRLAQYRMLGLQVALDHFGTGYASLAYLKRYDIDYVKIDPSLAQTLYETIVAMAHNLGLKVVAEGVEAPAQRALLVDAGCDYAQGYMFGHPMTAAELEALALRITAA